MTLEMFFNAFASSLSMSICKSRSSSNRVDQVIFSTRPLYRFKVYTPAPPFTFSTLNCIIWSRDNRFNSKDSRVRLNTWKKYFTMRVVRHWTGYLGKLWIFRCVQGRLNIELCQTWSREKYPCQWQGDCPVWFSKASSNPNHSTIKKANSYIVWVSGNDR